MGRKLSAEAIAFIEWDLTDPDERDPATQAEWCAAHGVDDSYPGRWRTTESWLRAREARSTAFDADDDGSLDDLLTKGNIEQVVKAAHAAALGGDVSAMKTYLQYATAFETPDDTNVRGMTDAQLAEALEDAAVEVRARLAAP